MGETQTSDDLDEAADTICDVCGAGLMEGDAWRCGPCGIQTCADCGRAEPDTTWICIDCDPAWGGDDAGEATR